MASIKDDIIPDDKPYSREFTFEYELPRWGEHDADFQVSMLLGMGGGGLEPDACEEGARIIYP